MSFPCLMTFVPRHQGQLYCAARARCRAHSPLCFSRGGAGSPASPQSGPALPCCLGEVQGTLPSIAAGKEHGQFSHPHDPGGKPSCLPWWQGTRKGRKPSLSCPCHHTADTHSLGPTQPCPHRGQLYCATQVRDRARSPALMTSSQHSYLP